MNILQSHSPPPILDPSDHGQFWTAVHIDGKIFLITVTDDDDGTELEPKWILFALSDPKVGKINNFSDRRRLSVDEE